MSEVGAAMVRVPVPTRGLVPKPPAHVTATGRAPDAIQLAWTASASAFAYTVYRATSASGPFTHPLVGVPAGIFQGFYDSGLAPDTAYYYVVTASNAAGESIKPTTGVPGTTLLVAPTGVLAYGFGPTSITVAWPSAGSAITSYTIYRSPTASGSFDKIATVDATHGSYTDTGIAPGATFYYEVSAASTSNHSLPSTPPAAGTTKPDAPTGVTAQATSSTSIAITWNQVSGAAFYAIYIDGPELFANYVGSTTSTSFTDTNLPRGATRCYRVLSGSSAHSAGGISDPPACATTPWLSPPSMVTADAVSAHRIRLTWPAVPGATTYTVKRSADPSNGPWTTASPTGGTTSPFDDDGSQPPGTGGLVSNTTYYYEVAASDNAGHTSPASMPAASATTWLNAPALVEAHSTTATTIQITWSPVTGATNYTVSRSLSVSEPFMPIPGQPVSGPPVTDSPGTPGATFFYEVSAANNSGNKSPSSSPASATLAPAPPVFQSAVGNQGMTVTMSWSRPTGAGGFNIYKSSDGSAWTPATPQPQTGTSFAITAAMATVTNWWTVTSVNSGGESAKAMPALHWTGSGSPAQ